MTPTIRRTLVIAVFFAIGLSMVLQQRSASTRAVQMLRANGVFVEPHNPVPFTGTVTRNRRYFAGYDLPGCTEYLVCLGPQQDTSANLRLVAELAANGHMKTLTYCDSRTTNVTPWTSDLDELFEGRDLAAIKSAIFSTNPRLPIYVWRDVGDPPDSQFEEATPAGPYNKP